MPVMMRVVASVSPSLCVSVSFVSSVAARNYPPGRSEDGTPPARFSGEAPGRGPGDKVPQKQKQFADFGLQISTAENNQNLQISHNSPPDS